MHCGRIRFCFQAEDGIRYLVRSRGLGDVYKRQLVESLPAGKAGQCVSFAVVEQGEVVAEIFNQSHPVSYTHLTLPTSDLV